MKPWIFLFLCVLAAAPARAELRTTDLVDSLRSALAAHYAMEGEWQVDLVRDIDLPVANEVLVDGFPARPSSNMVVRVRFLHDGKRMAETNLSIRVQLWRDALVSGETLSRGQSLAASQLNIQRLDMLRESHAVSADEALEGDYIYSRSIPAGRILNWRDLQRRPIVQRGQIVEVAAVDGGLSVVLKAMALENGARGDLIRVRNLQSKRDIAALVVSEGRTQISF